MAADAAALAVYGDAGEVAHVLVGTGQLVEERRLAAVLVARQGEGEHLGVGQGVFVLLVVVGCSLAQSGVGHYGGLCRGRGALGLRRYLDADACCVSLSQGQFVGVYLQLYGVAHGGVFAHAYDGSGDETHVEEVLAERSLAAHAGDACRLVYV